MNPDLALFPRRSEEEVVLLVRAHAERVAVIGWPVQVGVRRVRSQPVLDLLNRGDPLDVKLENALRLITA